MKCRHGHRWLGDRCVMGWCRQDVEEEDRVSKFGSTGFTWSWDGNLAVPDQVESEGRMVVTNSRYLTELEATLQENLSSMAGSVRVPVINIRCSDIECRLCNSEVWDE